MFWGKNPRDGRISWWLTRGKHRSRTTDLVDVRSWDRKTCNGKVPWWLAGDEHRTDWVTSYLAAAARMNHTVIISQLLCAPVDVSILSFHGRPIGHHAAETGSLDAIKMLVRSGVNPHAKDNCGRNMVHIASQFGQLQMLNYLLNIGVEHGAVDKSGQTPLHLVGEKQPVKAAKYRSPNLDECSVKVGCERRDSVAGGYSVTKTIVARLVDAGADVMVPNMSGQTPIEFWLHRGEHETALVILKSICKTVKPDRFKQHGSKLLHTAACLGHLEFAEALVEQGVSVDAVNDNKESPLLMAIAKGHTDMTKLLRRLGARADLVSHTGMSALHMAVVHSTPTIAAMVLKEYGISTCMRDSNGRTALDMAASKGRADMIRILLEGGAPVEHQGKGLTPLHHAADAGQAHCVRMLLVAKATAGHCWNDMGRKTPLFLASCRGYVSVVKILTPELTKRQIDMQDTVTMHTALTVAIAGGHATTVQALLTAGANPKARGINGELPLALAALRPSTPKSASIVEALLRAGADPNAYSTRGIPILHTACGAVRGDGSTVELLIKAGAGVNAPSPGDDFVTPLHVAARSNNAPAVRILTAINRCKLNIQSSTLCRATPLGMAVQEGCSDVVQVLLEAGADIGAVPRNVLGQRHVDSLVNLAMASGHRHVAYLLSQALRSRDKVAEAKKY